MAWPETPQTVSPVAPDSIITSAHDNEQTSVINAVTLALGVMPQGMYADVAEALAAKLDVTGLEPSQGSLLVGDGSGWTSLPVGADNLVLSADATQAAGVRWNPVTATTAVSLGVTISQAGHGFSVGDVLGFNGTAYVPAQADALPHSVVAGIVAAVQDTGTFTLLTAGVLGGMSGLSPGSLYYLSATTPGGLTATEPTTPGAVSKPLLVATSTTTGVFSNSRGLVVPGVLHPWIVDVNIIETSYTSQGNWVLGIDSATPNRLLYAAWLVNLSGSVDDYIEWSNILLGPGTWKFKLRHSRDNNRGIYRVDLDGAGIGTIDGYASSATFNVQESLTHAALTTTVAQLHTLRLTVVSKNASSSSFYATPQWIQFERVG